MVTPDLRHLGNPEASATFEELFAVYATVYPEHSEEDLANFRERALRQFAGDGFDLVAAYGDEGGLAGFAYGLPLRGPGWWSGIAGLDGSPVPEEFTAEWSGRTFAVIELVVLPEHRGHGLGRDLLSELLGKRPEERATLAVDPGKPGNAAMYEHWGWHNAGRITAHADAPVPFFDLYWQALSSSR